MPIGHAWTYEEDYRCCELYLQFALDKTPYKSAAELKHNVEISLPQIKPSSLHMKLANIKCLSDHEPNARLLFPNGDGVPISPLDQYSEQCRRAFLHALKNTQPRNPKVPDDTKPEPKQPDNQSEPNDYWKGFIGTTIDHPAYGTGTITDANDNYLTVQFDTVGIKRLSSAWCVQKGLIFRENDYRTLLEKHLAEVLTDTETTDEKPTSPPIRKASPEKITDLCEFVERRIPQSYEHASRAYLLREVNRDTFWEEPTCMSPRVCGDVGRLPIPPVKPSFQKQFLLKMIERNMTSVDCYTKAIMDRKLFSKIMKREDYVPRKETAIALILTLSPTEREMNDLLKALGYCLSESNHFDLVIKYCIDHEIFNIDEINGYLYEMDLPLLGSCCA